MRQAASSILRDLEIRVAHLEKSASQKLEFLFQTYDGSHRPHPTGQFVSCALTQKALLECAKSKLGVECWFDKYEKNLVTYGGGLAIWVTVPDEYKEETGIYKASFKLENKYGSFKVQDILPLS